VGQAEPMADT